MSSLSSADPSGRFRRYCFTLNDYTAEECRQLDVLFNSDSIEYAVYGKEKAPTTGTLHLQGYFRFKNPRVWNQVKKSPGMERAHIEVCKADEKANRDYCTKGGDFVEFKPVNFAVGQGARTDLRQLGASILATGIRGLRGLAEECPDQFIRYSRGLMHLASFSDGHRELSSPPPCTFAFGPSGSGKSTFIHKLAKEYAASNAKRIYYWGMEFPWISQSYTGEEVIVIDDIRDVDFRGAKVPMNMVTKMIDVFPLTLQVKGSDVKFFGSAFFISCVMHPAELWKESGVDSNWQFGRRITSLYSCSSDGTTFKQELLPDARPLPSVQTFSP